MNTTKRQPVPLASSADWSIADGCPVCGGELEVRRRPGSAWSYCARCKLLSRPQIGMGPLGIQVLHPLAAC